MSDTETLVTRPLGPADAAAINRILDTSEYIHYRFEPAELNKLLERFPAFGVMSVPAGRLGKATGGTLQAFLLVNSLVPPSAWIGGFGVTWSQGQRFGEYLDRLLPQVEAEARARGANTVYYSGSDLDSDWLHSAFTAHDYALLRLLRSYDKADYEIPSLGNQGVTVRPFRSEDVAQVLEVERASFEQLWRYDAAGFLEVARTYPYFVVAEDAHGICGYQFNAVDTTTGYLVRIAVHPRAEGTGIGTRLMAEAIRYFARQHVWKILLNTEETNTRAHALYEWFGFERVVPQGFVLGHAIAPVSAQG